MNAAPPPLPREGFDLDPGLTWVMHCAEGPVPRRAADAVRDLLGRETRPWTLRWKEDFLGLPLQLRTLGGSVLGARPADLTIVATTTAGLVTVAQGFPWERGDEVLLPLGEFPSNAWPWLALAPRGVGVREVGLWDGHAAGRDAWSSAPPPPGVRPEERLLAAIGPRTRVLAASWVRFQDGLRLDLSALAALVVDGIQGAGTLVPDLAGVAAFATGGHKGLLAPQGLGLLATDAAFRARLAPPGGWLSVEDATDFGRASTDFDRRWLADGQALELGVPNLLGCAALAASLDLVASAGVPAIAAHVARLEARLLERLETSPAWSGEATRLRALLDGGRLGPILALHHGGRGAAFHGSVLEDGFVRRIYASVREGYLRVALHGWHDDEDVERVATWLGAVPPA